ncbi:hypothetical protein N7512_002254 [Penicillium capsulatum]|nr:hypothetical protein N7512_002254 [Penicillium capsulatum]
MPPSRQAWNAPCSRCLSLGRSCTFEGPSTPSEPLGDHGPSSASPSPSIDTIPGLPKDDPPFGFLRHFTNPSVKKDRLAIGETAKCSMRRNLETLYSNLEDALIPTDPIMSLLGDMRMPDFPLQLPSTSDDYLLQFPPDPLFPSKLSSQINEIMEELVETSKSMVLDNMPNHEPLDIADLACLFEVSHIYAFISAFFHSLHWHLPIVHFPTFNPGDVSKPLLLAIFLSGAAYTTPSDVTTLSPWLFDVAEEYIFRKISNLPVTSSPEDPGDLIPMAQLIQAALIMEMFQFGRDDMQTRRRIRIIRHPCLVSTIRSLGMFQLKRTTAPKECDDWTWRKLVAEEVCIRIACWVFLADGFLTVCFKNHPALSVFEMNCHLPWDTELWEAENASCFSKIIISRNSEALLPPLRDVISQLLESPVVPLSIPWSRSLSAEHLLMLIYAMNSLAFQARTGLLRYLPLDTIRRAAVAWKQMWDTAIGSPDQKKYLHLGYPKHAEELWWLLNATLDIASKRDASLAYLDNTATDELGNLNDFIQMCSRGAP